MSDQLVVTPLWQHQVDELARLDDGNIKRALIGWQMGTGKTLAAVEKDLRFRVEFGSRLKRTLVVGPLSTHDTWLATFQLNAPHLKVVVIDPKNRDAFLKTPGDVYIMHYEVLRLMPNLRGVFQHGIFDECHRIKNRKAKSTIAAKKLQIPLLTDMSGSPVTDRPNDFWSILNHLYPKTYSSYWKFFERYVDYEISYPQGFRKVKGPRPLWKAKGLPAIQPFYSRVLKDDVLELPPKIYDTIHVDLTPGQRKLYNQMRDDAIAWVKDSQGEETPLWASAVIAKLQRLQMFALGTMEFDEASERYTMTMPSSKIDTVREIIRDNDTESFLVYSQFKGPLYLLRDHCAQGKPHQRVHVSVFTGDESHAERQKQKQLFVEGKTRVLAATIASIGTGTDGLQRNCSHQIFLDRAWSPMANEQAEDRLHRGGQTKPVNITTLMARDTVDFERVARIEQKKQWVLEMLGDR